jgi:CRP/FNR family transcriptional regulator
LLAGQGRNFYDELDTWKFSETTAPSTGFESWVSQFSPGHRERISLPAISEDGEKQVTGFYLPGEVVALDSVSTNHYSCSAEALERSSLCEIPLNRLEELAARIPSLQQHFFQLMSHEIQSGQQMSMLLSRRTAEERLASFLLSLSTRFNRRRLSPTHFRLPMARNDIANYLGLAVETVSRVLTRFQKQELVLFHGRNCTLVDIDGLKNIVHHYNSLCE